MKPSNFEFNKIIAALLLASIIAMVSGFIAMGLYTGSLNEHQHAEVKRGYEIEVPDMGDGGETAVVEEAPVDIAPFMETANLENGEKQIKKCTACHTFEKGGKHGVGPNQWGLFGANFAHTSDYSYSDALLAKKDMVWNAQNLSEFLEKPRKFIPGNKMAFAGIKNPQDRADLITYLKTLK